MNVLKKPANTQWSTHVLFQTLTDLVGKNDMTKNMQPVLIILCLFLALLVCCGRIKHFCSSFLHNLGGGNFSMHRQTSQTHHGIVKHLMPVVLCSYRCCNSISSGTLLSRLNIPLRIFPTFVDIFAYFYVLGKFSNCSPKNSYDAEMASNVEARTTR